MSYTQSKKPVTPNKRAWINKGLAVFKLGSKRQAAATDLPDDVQQGGEGSSTDQLARDALQGTGERIHRDIKLGPIKLAESKDKRFQENVDDRVEAMLGEVDAVLASDGARDKAFWQSVQKLAGLNNDLAQEKQRYAGLVGAKNNSKDRQRQTKVDAIAARTDGLDKLLAAKIGPDWKEQSAWQAINAKDGQDREPTPQQVDERIAQFVGQHKGDQAFVEKVFTMSLERQVQIELAGKKGGDLMAAKNALFRGNIAPTKMAVAYLEADAEGQGFFAGCTDALKDGLRGVKTGGELRPSAIKEAKFRKDNPGADEAAFNNQSLHDNTKMHLTDDTVTDAIRADYDRIAGALAAAAGQVVDAIMAAPVPDAVAAFAARVAKQVREHGLNDAEVVKAVGAFVVLRFANGALGKALATLGPDERRAGTYITKAIQNVANGVLSVGGKDAYTQPMLDAVAKRSAAMTAWLLDIVRQGEALRGDED